MCQLSYFNDLHSMSSVNEIWHPCKLRLGARSRLLIVQMKFRFRVLMLSHFALLIQAVHFKIYIQTSLKHEACYDLMFCDGVFFSV